MTLELNYMSYASNQFVKNLIFIKQKSFVRCLFELSKRRSEVSAGYDVQVGHSGLRDPHNLRLLPLFLKTVYLILVNSFLWVMFAD